MIPFRSLASLGESTSSISFQNNEGHSLEQLVRTALAIDSHIQLAL